MDGIAKEILIVDVENKLEFYKRVVWNVIIPDEFVETQFSGRLLEI